MGPAGLMLINQDDESNVTDRRYFSEASMTAINLRKEAIDDGIHVP